MVSFLDLNFWVVSALAVLALRWQGRAKALSFGLFSLGFLAWALGAPAAAAAAAFSCLGWCLLALALRLRQPTAPLVRTAYVKMGQRQEALVGAAVGSKPGLLGEASWSMPAAGEPGDNPTAWHIWRPRLALLASAACLAAPLVLFLAHKLFLERPAVQSWASAGLKVVFLQLQLLGFSYVVLRYVDAVHSILWKKAPLLDPISFAGYLFPFHMLLAGPVNRYDDHANRKSPLWEPTHPDNRWIRGMNDLATGLFFKFVVAEQVRLALFGQGPLISHNWVDTACLLVYLFFDFAGYSRLALGLGRLLGVPTPVNFNAPFQARTVTEFFTRWHMSLGGFVLRNLYTPMQLSLVRRWGVRRAHAAGLVALVSAWTVVGLWHRLSLRFLLYGLGMALVVWLEKWVRDRCQKQPWFKARWVDYATMILGPLYVFAVLTAFVHLVIEEILPS